MGVSKRESKGTEQALREPLSEKEGEMEWQVKGNAGLF